MSYLDDPRVFFAAERTLLAWVRTGITVCTLGFVVAKFAVFLAFVARHEVPATGHHAAGEVIGLLLVLLGSACCLGAAVQFRRFTNTLTGDEVPPRWSAAWPPLLATTIAAAGLGLAFYLIA
jgi:putative membrane protein